MFYSRDAVVPFAIDFNVVLINSGEKFSTIDNLLVDWSIGFHFSGLYGVVSVSTGRLPSV